ncbi:MAG: serine/threonine-protein kinase PksC [Chthoniobacteraceae bacterium]|nr:serine/threonine-protein kinase PksC [Chthoniobacteraceae bacterium]
MGVVWLARDEKEHNKRVALKFLKGFDAEALALLQRNVRRNRGLNHPGIVAIYDFHESRGEHLAAISMEWIDGPSVADIQAEQPDRSFEPTELLPWLKQVCDALGYLHHEVGSAHGHLKPGNIMIGEHGHLKLADAGFGDAVKGTEPGQPRSALAYLSPQRLTQQPAEPADDIYAVGAIFYELLTGTPPFHQGSIDEVIFQIAYESQPSLAGRREELRSIGRPAIAVEWEKLVADCLAKEPGERPSGPEAIAARLIEPGDSAAGPAKGDLFGEGSTASPKQRSSRIWFGAIASLLVIGALIAIGTHRQPIKKPVHPSDTAGLPVKSLPPSPPIPVTPPAPTTPAVPVEPSEPVAVAEPAPVPTPPVPPAAPPELSQQQRAASIKQANESYIRKDYAAAFKLYSDAAEWNDAWAIFQLGKMYSEGSGIARDKKKAMELYQEAAAQGNARALSYLGQIYENGDGVNRDLKKAKEFYQQAMFLVLHDAAKGNAPAQYDLGVMYATGRGIGKNPAKAVELYEKAAVQGDADAQLDLGLLYASGRGAAKNPMKAVRLLEQAAVQGSDVALYHLATIYETGQGVPEDERKAVELYLQAAQHGNRLAMRALARFYESGRGGLPKDLAKARELRQRAK